MTRSVPVRIRSFPLASATIALACAASSSAHARQSCAPERVSVATGGAQSPAGSFAGVEASVSADGRWVAFNSTASTLVAGDTNNTWDAFLRDRQSGTTERISVDASGAQGAIASGVSGLGLSADGNRVAFTSGSPLVAGDTNTSSDVYVRDRATGQLHLVSVGTTGVATGGCLEASISADGRHVAFTSSSGDLVPGDTNHQVDVFVRDLVAGTTQRVSVSSTGAQGDSNWFDTNWFTSAPALSADGRYVAFASAHDNLVPGDTNSSFEPEGLDVFVRDRLLGTTSRVSVSTAGVEANNYSERASISADGRYVAFDSYATNLAPNSTGGVFVHDRATGETTLASRSTGGAPGSQGARFGRIAADGRHVLFASDSPNLVPGDVNGRTDVFLRDLANGTTSTVSSAVVPGNNNSFASALSPDGRVLVWSSYASNLVAGDTNGAFDAFVSECPIAPWTAFCAGSAIACPCANGGAAYSGCDNSLATGGGRLIASGAASLSADTLVLAGSGMSDSSALYFQGTTQQAGGAGSVFGDGLRCAGGTLVRIATTTNSGGASSYPTGAAPSVSQRGMVAAPGSRMYQAWYRNAAAFCTAATFNLTNGIAVDWQS